MEKIVAIIEKGSDGGYSIYARDFPGAYGYGLTEEEAKEDFTEVLSEQIEYMSSKGKSEVPNKYDANHIEYRYDFSGFFKSFPFFNVTELAKELGINASLFRRYKTGNAQASVKQKEKIQEYFDKMVDKLQNVKF